MIKKEPMAACDNSSGITWLVTYRKGASIEGHVLLRCMYIIVVVYVHYHRLGQDIEMVIIVACGTGY